MNNNWIIKRIDEYYRWMKDNTIIKSNDTGWSSISTPYLGLFNDFIQIYIKKEGAKILFSDDKETITNLDLVGMNIFGSNKRKELVQSVLLNYGVTLKGEELYAESTIESFPKVKHNFISAISELSDLELLAKPTIVAIFKEYVEEYFNDLNIIYTPEFIAKGSTGLEFTFDYHIAGRSNELVINTFNTLNQSSLERFLFSWEDIKGNRERKTNKEMNSLAIINDIEKKPKQEYLEALEVKNSAYMLWSEKDYKEKQNLFKIAS